MHVNRLLASAVAALGALGGALSARAQIVFTPPADAPQGGAGTVGILEVTANGGIGDQNAARTSLNGGGTRVTGTGPNVDYFNSDGVARGPFRNAAGTDRPFLSDPTPGNGDNNDVENISILYRGRIRVVTPGTYSFGVTSDDGFTLAFNNGTVPFTGSSRPNGATIETYNGNANGAFTFLAGRGAAPSIAQVNFAAAGDYSFDLTYHEGGGGSGIDFYSQAGSITQVDGRARRVGDTSASPAQASVLSVGQFDLIEFASSGTPVPLSLATVVNSGRSIKAGGAATDNAVQRGRNNVQAIQFVDDADNDQNYGSHGGDRRVFPADPAGANNDFGAYATATLTVGAGQAGQYTFALFSDDNSQFRILGPGGTDAVEYDSIGGTNVQGADSADDADAGNDTFGFLTANCCGDVFGTYTLAQGTYTVETAFQEGGGGAGFFLYAAPGNKTAFDGTFTLLGGQAAIPGGFELVAVPEPATASLLALGAAGLLARRRRRSA